MATYASDELLQAVLDWEKNEHQYSFDKDAVGFVEGVVPSISSAIQASTKEGEAVLINSHVYPILSRRKTDCFKLILNN